MDRAELDSWFVRFMSVQEAADEISELTHADADYIASDMRAGVAFSVAGLVYESIGGEDVHVSRGL